MDRGNELLKESVVMANELDVAGEFIYAASLLAFGLFSLFL